MSAPDSLAVTLLDMADWTPYGAPITIRFGHGPTTVGLADENVIRYIYARVGAIVAKLDEAKDV